MHVLDVAETGVGRTRNRAAHRAGNRLVDVLEALQVTALSAQVSDFECPVRGQLALDVEQILHGVAGVVLRLHGIGERRGNVGRGAAAAGNRVAIEQVRACPCSK